jgi:zinc/manganese transport system substrate-binding protein
MNRRLIAASALVLPALALAGCAGTPTEAEDTSAEGDAFRIVASTSVYSSIAEQLVGDAAEVSAIVDSPTQDPHSYEATARDRLAVEGADLVILNGGGYDHFMEELAEEAGVEHVITVVEYSHDYPGGEGHEHAEDEHAEGDEHAHEEAEGAEDHDHDHEAEDEHAHEEGDEHGHEHIEGFNEHVWYDPHTIAHFAEDLAGELEGLLPDAASDIAGAEEALLSDIDGLEASLEDLAAEHAGAKVFFTEPVGGYLTAEAVEEGQDVAPATLLAAIEAIEGGDIDVLVTNAQTGGAETERAIAAAEGAGVPVVEYTETLPEGDTYVEWMSANVEALGAALAG